MTASTPYLLASKIAALDPEAQHAVEIAVDSLLVDAGLGPNIAIDARFAALERRVDAIGEQNPGDELVLLDEHDCHEPSLISAIEHLMHAAQRTLEELHRANFSRAV